MAGQGLTVECQSANGIRRQYEDVPLSVNTNGLPLSCSIRVHGNISNRPIVGYCLGSCQGAKKKRGQEERRCGYHTEQVADYDLVVYSQKTGRKLGDLRRGDGRI